jgi:hypothetical protein
MSARLTLLLLCDQTELHSPFISALLAAGFQLLIEHRLEGAKLLLSRLPADAIMVCHESLQDGGVVGAELKRIAPRTPIILFPRGSHNLGPQLGIDSVCHADPQDEVVARAVAVFFYGALTPPSQRLPVAAASPNVRVSAPKGKITTNVVRSRELVPRAGGRLEGA